MAKISAAEHFLCVGYDNFLLHHCYCIPLMIQIHVQYYGCRQHFNIQISHRLLIRDLAISESYATIYEILQFVV